MDEPLTKSLERYDVLDRIAVGGMAEVFLAKAYGAHGFEKTLAIKRILPELARDPEFEARFIAEAKVAVRLSHANVVQVLDFGRIGESLFIAMEFVDGLDLAAMLRKFKDEKRLVPLPAAFHIAIEIVRALDFAHQHNVVHRDVSPSNVLVSRAGEVKIADFGIAVAAQPHRNSAPGPKRVMGKWRYMSPEQARGDTLDTRSDLFSAASVIFELFTGEKLFPGDEAEDIIKNIHNMVIPKMSSLRPGLPSRLDEVIAGPLSRKPIDRPTRPAAILRSLIELSYESSIMATALDVAEALATVIPIKRISGSGALDDVIRKQLNEQSVARRTAVTDNKPPSTETAAREKGEVSTGLFRKIDIDGLPRLEEADAATRVAAPRAKRNTSQGDHVPGDTDLHALYDASQDRDRHTEVGGPPTGQVPKLGDSMNAMKPATDVPAGKPRRLVWLLVAIAIVGLGSIAVWAMTRSSGGAAVPIDAPRVVTPPPPDAAPDAMIEQVGTLVVRSQPPGALVTIGDKTVGPNERAKIPAGVSVHVKLTLKGHDPLEFDYSVGVGENIDLVRELKPSQATLHVETTPPGAQVSVNNQQICAATPCDAKLAAAKDLVVVVTKDKHESLRQTVTLVAGETTPLKIVLKEGAKFGFVRIEVKGPPVWGYVAYSGGSLGVTGDASGPRLLKLPVGRHTLSIVKNDKKGAIVVDVKESETSSYAFSWP